MELHDDTIRLPAHTDSRGELRVIEGTRDIPFEIKRVFFISNVPEGARRGEHAYNHNEFAVCTAGRCSIKLIFRGETKCFTLEANAEGLLIPARSWRVLYGFSPDCVLTVVSDACYDPEDYVFDFETFLLNDAEQTDRAAL